MLIGLLGLNDYITINENAILESVFALTVTAALFRRRFSKDRLLITSAGFAYLVFTAIVASARNVYPADYLVAFKFVFYLMLLGLVPKKKLLSASDFVLLYRLSLFAFALRYLVERFALGIDRPTLLVENNFELIFLLLLFYAKYLITSRASLFDFLLLLFIFGVSGSRSSIVSLGFVFGFCIQWRSLRARDIALVFSLGIIGLVALVVFNNRGGGADIESIDRVKFFAEFMRSTSDWSFIDFVFGAPVLTPLSPASCAALSFYQKLFSFSGDGSCYSVILHSFVLRVVYDHGLLGLVTALAAVWVLLRDLPVRCVICVLGVILLTGLSVSSLNNIYVTLGLLMLMSVSVATASASIPLRSLHVWR